MNRKIDEKFETILPSAPEVWYEKQRKHVLQPDGSYHVEIVDVKSTDIDKEQLDPAVYTLSQMLEKNLLIDAGDVGHILNVTDPASIEYQVEHISGKAYSKLSELPNFDFDKNTFVKEVENEG